MESRSAFEQSAVELVITYDAWILAMDMPALDGAGCCDAAEGRYGRSQGALSPIKAVAAAFCAAATMVCLVPVGQSREPCCHLWVRKDDRQSEKLQENKWDHAAVDVAQGHAGWTDALEIEERKADRRG